MQLVKKGKKIRAMVSPPLFGQCPKENIFFAGGASYRSIKKNNLVVKMDAFVIELSLTFILTLEADFQVNPFKEAIISK